MTVGCVCVCQTGAFLYDEKIVGRLHRAIMYGLDWKEDSRLRCRSPAGGGDKSWKMVNESLEAMMAMKRSRHSRETL